MDKVKPIAIYLPQYHPIPENDRWWGKGFTEWINVTKSKPKFTGHYQPHLPKDLGFYDLRLIDTMVEQAKLAQQYGVYGFCYYHYWFNGKLLLEKPIEQMLNTGKPDIPFCLCWANENWSRRWDGSDQEILIDQKYSLDDDLKHIQYLMPFFKDERYIKIDNKPVFLMYRSELHPQINEATQIWRDEAKRAGLEDLYLIRVENFVKDFQPQNHGFDAGMEFAPDFSIAGSEYLEQFKVKYFISRKLHQWNIRKSPFFDHKIYSYDELANNQMNKEPVNYVQFKCVCPSWDNSARRALNAYVFHKSSPAKFAEWIRKTKEFTETNFENSEKLFFINAWNEWGEGCHLEPDQKFGSAYLKALALGLNS